MYRAMAGLDTYEDGVGYKHIKIMPHPGGGFTNATASLQTYYGKLSSGWKIENGNLLLDVEIPVNTTATVYVPAANADSVTESGNAVSSIKDIKLTGSENGYAVLQLGSGNYHFKTPTEIGKTAAVLLIDFPGKYKMQGLPFEFIDISVKNDKLFMQAGNNSSELEPGESEDQFKSNDTIITFFRDQQKKVVSLKYDSGLIVYEGVKQ
jgi:alpha-L-rhamnosidase